MIGGAGNMKGFALPNVSRLLVYRLGGTLTLPEAPPMQRPPLDPPPATASMEVVGRGAPLYETWCGSCHGAGVVGVGLLPDLRRTPMLRAPDLFESVVLGGTHKALGMASFADVFDEEDVQAILAYVTLRANQDAAAAGD
jgi:alcohol dehydrogenase (cytochrome c)/quinohemoprotein ethanol dehydrogenase